MMGSTHLVGGVASLWLLAPFVAVGTLPPESIGATLIGALLGSLWPDLDARDSKLKRFPIYIEGQKFQPFALTADVLHQTLGHRGLLHSLLGLIFAALIPGIPLALLFGASLTVGFLLGFISHLFLDACTMSGIPLFYPKRSRWNALPETLRLSTGSAREDTVFFLLVTLSLILFLHI